MRTLNIIFVLVSLVLISCEKPILEGKVVKSANRANELRNVPETISIDNHNYFLATELWRSFQPPVQNEDGGRLAGISELTEQDSLEIPSNIYMSKQYVICGNEIWIADFEESGIAQSHIITGLVRNGPRWGPDVLVDVVCEFDIDGSTYQILARSQKILKVE